MERQKNSPVSLRWLWFFNQSVWPFWCSVSTSLSVLYSVKASNPDITCIQWRKYRAGVLVTNEERLPKILPSWKGKNKSKVLQQCDTKVTHSVRSRSRCTAISAHTARHCQKNPWLLEKDCHSLDEHVTKLPAKTDGDVEGTSDSFPHYMQKLKSQEGKKQQLQKLQSCVALMGDTLQKEAFHQKIEQLKKDITTTTKNGHWSSATIVRPRDGKSRQCPPGQQDLPSVISWQGTDRKTLQQVS